MPVSQPEQSSKANNLTSASAKAVSKATISKAFDNKSPSVKERVRQWQDQGGAIKSVPANLKTSSDIEKRSSRMQSEDEAHNDRAAEDVGKADSRRTQELNPEILEPAAGTQEDLGVENSHPSPQIPLKRKQAAKKKPQSNTKVRIAQAIIGPTVRPSERLRRLSEARKDGKMVLSTSEEAQATEIRKNAREQLKSKEIATPPKRIISDSRWRHEERSSFASYDAAQSSGGKAPLVEGWLENISSQAVSRTLPLETKALDASRTDDGSCNEMSDEEYRSYPKTDENAARTPPEDYKSAERKVAYPIRSDHISMDFNAKSSNKKDALRTEEYSTAIGESQALAIPPTGFQPTFRSSAVEASVPAPKNSQGKHENNQNDNSPCSSISDESRRRQIPERTRRNIFSHATKFLFRSDPKSELRKDEVLEAMRVPNVQSWLEHACDPFTDSTLRLPLGQEITVPLEEVEALHEEKHKDIGAFNLQRLEDSGENFAQNEGKSSDTSQNKSRDLQSRRRRVKRVLRHRDGTVTVENGTSSNEGLHDEDEMSNSDYVLRRGGASAKTNYVSEEGSRSTPMPKNQSPRSKKTQLAATSTSRQDADTTGKLVQPPSSEKLGNESNKITKVKGSRSLTKHSDLISVLSLSFEESSVIPSARSLRTRNTLLSNTTIENILEQFAMDEAKYARELYILIEGVIPVIFSEILTSSSAYITTDLIASSNREVIAKGILDMGLALDKLRTHHRRSAHVRENEFLVWVMAVLPYYHNYLKVWRLGFQDAVVNLAVRNDPEEIRPDDQNVLHGPVLRDSHNHENRVDIAYFLRRPLVRMKNITKTMKRLIQLEFSEDKAALVHKCEEFVEASKKKSNDERARLEDQSAARIDASRSRDPRTLTLVSNVLVPSHRRVKARDTFDLKFLHSNGQRLDCKVELCLRDDPPNVGSKSDILISQVDGTGHFLLFPPLDAKTLSARNGDTAYEIIVMIRDSANSEILWYELLSLTTDEEHIVLEWINLLGASPVPPPDRLSDNTIEDDMHASNTNEKLSEFTLPSKTWQTEAPIGESLSQSAILPSRVWAASAHRRFSHQNPSTIIEETSSALAADADPLLLSTLTTVPKTKHKNQIDRDHADLSCQATSLGSDIGNRPLYSSNASLKRSGAQKKFKLSSNQASYTSDTGFDKFKPFGELSESLDPYTAKAREETTLLKFNELDIAKRPNREKARRYHTLKEGVSQRTGTKASIEEVEFVSEDVARTDAAHVYSTPAGLDRDTKALPVRLERKTEGSSQIDEKIQPRDVQSKASAAVQSEMESGLKRLYRRMSSPLKHEYAPSNISTESSSEPSIALQDDSSKSVSSDSDYEDEDTPSVLVPMSAVRRYRKTPRTTLTELPAKNNTPLSQSTSQLPYRCKPSQIGEIFRITAMISAWSSKGYWESLWPQECLIVISPGLVEAYELPAAKAERMSPSREVHSSRQSPRPLLGLELTPLVPIRRGTAIDISIRSPPTPDSKIAISSSNNFLFRSPNAELCEMLYLDINRSRINNPTYIALQNARATSFTPHFQGMQPKSEAEDGRSLSWFGLGRSRQSYRAAGLTAPSISRNTESSVSSLTSAFSAFRNFGRIGSRFNIARSTMSSRQGSRSEDSYATSEGTGQGDMSIGLNNIVQTNDGTLGLSNCRIRLYLRESTTKWSDLGSARLAIMKPSTHPEMSPRASLEASNRKAECTPTQIQGDKKSWDAGSPTLANSLKELTSPGNKASSDDKRILITTSAKTVLPIGENPRTLLDVTLGETCFERVARTGIAVSVWENFEGGMVAKQGGVIGGKLRVYMMQFRNEADTAYTYSIVGKLRY